MIPGRHVAGGDAWLLELRGLAVDVLEPAPPLRLGGAPASVPLEANVILQCGCPLIPGGIWDAEDYEIRALLFRDGETVGEVPLRYAGRPSRFRGEIPVPGPGTYEVTVYAYEPATGNAGLDRTTLVVE